MCQLSFQGCSVCLQLLEKRPNKVPFPHLYPIRERREHIIKNIEDLFLLVEKVLGGKRTSCTRSRSRPFFCTRCDCHFILGTSSACEQKVNKHIEYYTTNYASSCQPSERNLDLFSRDDRMITAMASISSVSEMKSAIGKCKESVASKLNPNWQEQVRTHVKDPMDWKVEETIFP